MEINGASLTVEVALQLALKFRAKHPAVAAQVTKKSKAKVQVQMPARQRRRHN